MSPAQRDGVAPYFFLGYAHTPERRWVEKLFQDLSTEVYERTTLGSPAGVGFMDGFGIPLGGDWRVEVARALATCRVFVPLYSPRYFAREECGYEWNAFERRIVEHRARYPGDLAPIVPALWTPVEPDRMPEVARRIQMNHADLGADYAQEGFYTLIKNSLYRETYTTAVQRLARHIIRAGEESALRPCEVNDFDTLRNAFDTPRRQEPGPSRLTIVVAAPGIEQLPAGCTPDFYQRSSLGWNPFQPETRQAIAYYAAEVARLHSYVPALLPFDDGYEVLRGCDPSSGLGLLLVDAWSSMDADLAERLRELDGLDMEWVGVMVPWNRDARQSKQSALDLLARLRRVMPRRLGSNRPSLTALATRISSLEQFRARLPEVLDTAFYSCINHVKAYPPVGRMPARPVLDRPQQQDPVGRDGGTGDLDDS